MLVIRPKLKLREHKDENGNYYHSHLFVSCNRGVKLRDCGVKGILFKSNNQYLWDVTYAPNF